VGKTINWKTNTIGCKGLGGMTDCITSTPGTIGYIDSGHGHAEGLQEIELKTPTAFLSAVKKPPKGVESWLLLRMPDSPICLMVTLRVSIF
jgi:hypothetical protein